MASAKKNTKRNLAKLYDELNKKFFRRRLPVYRVICKNLPWGLHGHCNSQERIIFLKKGLGQEDLRCTLLHEMCHIGTPGHGKRFQAKLTRLSEMGETWAKEELRLYETGETWNQSIRGLRLNLEEWVLQSPRPRFSSIVRFIANDWGMTSHELLQKVPWLRAAWQKVCQESKEHKRLKKLYSKKREYHNR